MVTTVSASSGAVVDDNLSALLAVLPVPMVVLDHHGVVLSWNGAAEAVFGWTAHEVMTKAIPIIPPLERDRANEIFYRLLDGHPVVDTEIERRRKDGSSVVLSLSAAPLRDATGQVARIVEIYADITAKKADHRELERLARHDPLTGAVNRTVLMSHIDGFLASGSPLP